MAGGTKATRSCIPSGATASRRVPSRSITCGIGCAQHGDAGTLDEYAMGAQLARAGRMTLPPENPRVDFEHFDWAVHFDASRFATFLRAFAEARGVRRIDARVAEVLRDGETENLRGVRLDSGEMLEASLYIDCSGFHRLLIEKRCNPASSTGATGCCATARSPCPARRRPRPIAPYTRSRALDAGWTWRIPLQNRVGNGYVYCSDHISDEQALAALARPARRPGARRAQLREVPRRPRAPLLDRQLRRHRPVERISRAAGIHQHLAHPDGHRQTTALLARRADARRRRARRRIQPPVGHRIRTHPRLHHPALQRQRPAAGQGSLWRYCREMPLPDTLTRKIALYRARGLIQQFDSESFFDPSWLCMYGNFGIDAESWDPLTNLLPLRELDEVTRRVRDDIARIARGATPHREFLRLAGALADVRRLPTPLVHTYS